MCVCVCVLCVCVCCACVCVCVLCVCVVRVFLANCINKNEGLIAQVICTIRSRTFLRRPCRHRLDLITQDYLYLVIFNACLVFWSVVVRIKHQNTCLKDDLIAIEGEGLRNRSR